MNKDLITKYNVPVPRYTSYPPANYFEPFTEANYRQAVDESNRAADNHLSFYFHIPFCRRLCHFCGCNSYAMAQPDKVAEYVEALHKEIDLVLPQLDKQRKISQIHYGGGSPTALPIHYLKELNEHLLSSFSTIEKPEIAIECHPGYLTRADWEELTACGFNRYSIGIQDFNLDVLKNVNRQPSKLPLEEIVALLRQTGAGINFDFLYGLPGQTADSFGASIEQAIKLHPDRLVTFSYAHVPWVSKRQLVLEKLGLPTGAEKEQMFEKAAQLLTQAGYCRIGLDHFVQPHDELYTALRSHQLHRNFQGYCTRRTTAQVYAFGVTGISQLDTAYAQNSKNIAEYVQTVNAGKLPIVKGYRLNEAERIARAVIETLMCNYHISWTDLGQRLHLSAEAIRSAIHYDVTQLSEMAADGLIRFDEATLSMTETGNAFVRNVAAALDPLMIHSEKSFSKPL